MQHTLMMILHLYSHLRFKTGIMCITLIAHVGGGLVLLGSSLASEKLSCLSLSNSVIFVAPGASVLYQGSVPHFLDEESTTEE